jgi:hypothetical protein
MTVDLSAIKIDENGIPIDTPLIGNMFGKRFREFGHGKIFKYLDDNVEPTRGSRDDRPYVWFIDKKLAHDIVIHIHTHHPRDRVDPFWFLESNEWASIFEGGKVYVMY